MDYCEPNANEWEADLKDLRGRLAKASAFLVFVTLVGIAGFSVIDPEAGVIRAFYMTPFTLTTVGYREAVAVNTDADSWEYNPDRDRSVRANAALRFLGSPKDAQALRVPPRGRAPLRRLRPRVKRVVLEGCFSRLLDDPEHVPHYQGPDRPPGMR
ncbi:MAG: hypothetical protein HKO77_06605 [Gemmatimonadetes bacterium]|nr:hypothetical protein [Gemmatimonadota bacterium]